MNDPLTDKAFWARYWESKAELAVTVNRHYLFYQQLEELIREDGPKSAIELGGFPGYYSIFLKKYFKIEATLLDYYIHGDILMKVLEKNDLKERDVITLEADLLCYIPKQQYDLVLSCGLIEHFQDTKEIIKRHLQFLKSGGNLFITLPNFRGINGWIQKVFDKENYRKHNLYCMDLDFLTSVCYELGLKNISVKYVHRFSVWLENKNQKSFLTRVFVKVIWCLGKVVTKIIPFESKLLSPYILLQAKKE